MMGTKVRRFEPLDKLSLEDLVPKDHFYRHVERTLDLTFVRDLVTSCYAPIGRPSVDPVVFFKLQLAMFFECIRSERQLMDLATDRLSLRWFLGYDLHEKLPDHSSLSKIRDRYGVTIFRRFFDRIVEQCQQAGLVWGRELYFDSTQVEANADRDKMLPRFYIDAMNEHLAALFPEVQLIVLNRSIKRPRLTGTDRSLLVLVASRVQALKGAVLIVKPDTLVRWHRQSFRLFWRRKSRIQSRPPRIPAGTIALIQEMASNNRFTQRAPGVKRIQGELLKLNIKVSKRTIARYIRQVRPLRPHGQRWATFLQNHAQEIWACDFLQLHNALFRPLFAFFITDLGSRRIMYVGVTRSPTNNWAAQQLRVLYG